MNDANSSVLILYKTGHNGVTQGHKILDSLFLFSGLLTASYHHDKNEAN